jgi:hypothetical protein
MKKISRGARKHLLCIVASWPRFDPGTDERTVIWAHPSHSPPDWDQMIDRLIAQIARAKGIPLDYLLGNPHPSGF